jgi:hypothetical protein
LRYFVVANGWRWDPRPSIDDAEATVLAIAAGELDEAGTADWLRHHLAAPIRDEVKRRNPAEPSLMGVDHPCSLR